jgi:hypothetical protein
MSTVLFTDRTTPGVSATVDGRGVSLVAVNMSFTGTAATVRLEGETDGVWSTVESYVLNGDGQFGAYWVEAARDNYRVTIDSIAGSLDALLSTVQGGAAAYGPDARAAASARAAAESAAQAVDAAVSAETSASNAAESAEYTAGLLSTKVSTDYLASANGAVGVGYESPTGIVFNVAQYCDRNKLFAGAADEVQNAIDYANSQGGRDVTLLPFVIYDFGLSTLSMKAGVELKSDTGHAVSVQHLATGNVRGLPILRCGAISGDFITVPSDAYNNVLRNLIIDARLQVTGDALKYSDAAGVQRADSKAENILVYKHGPGAAIHIAPNHKEGGFREVFARCGSGVANANDGQFGLVCESIDWDFGRLLCGFAKERSFKFTGGACRFRDLDAWGSQDISVEIQGTSSTFDRLQVDGSGNSGVLIDGGDDVVIDKLISINNCLTALTPTDDIIIRGECRSMALDLVRLRGSAGNIRYGIGMEDTATGAGDIGSISCAASYLDTMNDRARAYFSISGATNALSPARGASKHVEPLTVNPLFTKWTGSLPDGLTARGSATAAQITPAGMTTGNYTSGARVTSGAVGVSGLQVILDKDKYKGRRIHCEGWFKGSSLTYLGNQRIQIFDGVTTHVEVIPNDNQWHWIAIDVQMDIAATDVQIRLVAANDTTTALPLEMTAVYYWAY